MDFETWMASLRRIAVERYADHLHRPSPWVGITLGESLTDTHEECWLDRHGAGYTPEEALSEAIR